MSTTKNQDQATGTTTSFRLTTIPFSRIAAVLASDRPSNTPTSRPGPGNNLHADATLCCTADFNTHHHSRAELAAALQPPPPTSHLPSQDDDNSNSNNNADDEDIDGDGDGDGDGDDDEDHPAFAYSTWLRPLIAPSQHIPTSSSPPSHHDGNSTTVVSLPRLFVADVLLAAHARWLRTDALPAALVADLLADWPGVVARLETAIVAAAAAASTTPTTATATTDGEQRRCDGGEEGKGGGGGGGGAFVRLDACSPKDSALHDATGTPVRGVGDAVRVLAGSMRAAGAMGRWLDEGRKKGRGCEGEVMVAMRLCVVPWNARMDPENEFRVFVPPSPRRSRVVGEEEEEDERSCGGLRISAISQYRWCEPLRLREGMGMTELVGLTEEGAERLLGEILEVARRLEGRDGVMEALEQRGFVFDVAVMRRADDASGYEVQLVELNPFGAMTGCGSLLFHWIKDARVLYGLEEREFRVALDGQ